MNLDESIKSVISEAPIKKQTSMVFKAMEDKVNSLSKALQVGSNLNKGINKDLEGDYKKEFAQLEKHMGAIQDIIGDIQMEYEMAGFKMN